jgi:rod shape-determining protein MreC
MALRRRAVVGGLVVLALVLVTISFRDPSGGPAGAIQDTGSAVLHPFEVAGSRVARPFRDAYDWFDSLFQSRDDANKLRKENEQLRQQLIQNEFAATELEQLKQLLAFKEGPSFPEDYDGLAASVIVRPSSAFAQSVIVSRGSCDGVEKDAPVVTAQGLIGLVTRTTCHASRVTLLTDSSSAVSALDVKTDAAGIVQHVGATGSTLALSYVAKEDEVAVGDTIVTAGWRTRNLSSLYPKGIPIGKVTSVGQTDTDAYKQVQVQPFADFTSIDALLVLVRKAGS